MEHQVERELGREQRQEPLRGEHVRLDAQLAEVRPQVGDVLLKVTRVTQRLAGDGPPTPPRPAPSTAVENEHAGE